MDPDGKLISLLGIVNPHQRRVAMDDGACVVDHHRPLDGFDRDRVTVAAAIAAYRARAGDRRLRASNSLTELSRNNDGTDLRWVVLHLINETARHAGHADATSELLDGFTGE